MGNWLGPPEKCQRKHLYSFTNATTLVTEERSGMKRRLSLSSTIALDHMFWVNPKLLAACADKPDPVEENARERLLKRNCRNSADMAKSNAPVLLHFGDGVGSKGLALVSAPHFRKVRKSLPRDGYGACPEDGKPMEAIIWKLNEFRHFGSIQYVERNDTPWSEKRNVAVFRGTLTGTNVRKDIKRSDDDYTNCMNWIRCRLVYQYAGSEVVDAKLTSTIGEVNSTIRGVELKGAVLDMQQMLQYKALLLLEGNDVASGLKWALFSNSVVLMPPPTHTSWAMEELLEPYVHYVPVDADAGNVDAQMRWVVANDAEAQAIARRGAAWIRDLVLDDSAAADDAWIRGELVRRYGELFVEEGALD